MQCRWTMLFSSALAIAAATLPQPSYAGFPDLLSPTEVQLLTQPHLCACANESLDGFGSAFGSGHLDPDSYPDLAIGVPGEVLSGIRSGVVILSQGSGAGPAAGHFGYLQPSDAGVTGTDGDRFGAVITTADFDGDGHTDLVVGAPGRPSGALADVGSVFVFMGSAAGPQAGDMFGESSGGGTDEADDAFGTALAAGDFDDDGLPDLAVGTPGKSIGGTQAGVVYVFPGTGSGLGAGSSLDQGLAGGTNGNGDEFGAALAAGDFDGDGISDLAIGTPGEDVGGTSNAGAVFVLNGSAAGLTAGVALDAQDAGEPVHAGAVFGSVLTTGDFDGDGFSDLAIGAPGDYASASDDASGRIYVFLGSEAGLATGIMIRQEDAGEVSETADHFGASLAAGDLNGDGFDDLAAGAPDERPAPDPDAAGAVVLFPGGPAGITTGDLLTQELVGTSSEEGDAFGFALAIADWNGDGCADLAVGSPGEAPWSAPASGAVLVAAGFGAQPRLTHGGAVGATTDSTAKVWARADRAATLTVQFKLPEDPWPGTTSAGVPLVATDDFADATTLIGLAASTTYDYRVLFDGVVDSTTVSTFRTLPPASVSGTFTFLMAGDLRFAGYNPYDPFVAMAARDADFTLLMGDQIYADAPNDIVTGVPGQLPDVRAAYRRKYKENWGERRMADYVRSHSTIMIWDDHEIDNDWDQGQFERYYDAVAAYDEYQDAMNPGFRPYGVEYYDFRVGQVDFFVLDTRTYRSDNAAPDDSFKTMLGATQKAALLDWLANSDGVFRFIVSSVPWRTFAETHNDKWSGYLTERDEIFAFIRDQVPPGVVLLSGDQHYAGVYRLHDADPYVLHEFNTTPIGTDPFPVTPVDAAVTDVLFEAETYNFGAFVLDTGSSAARGEPFFDFDVLDSAGTSLYHERFFRGGIAGGGDPEAPPIDPDGRMLSPNVPNPFSGETRLELRLETAGHAKVLVYDAAGRLMETLVDGPLAPGRHELLFDGGRVPPGVYFCRVEANDRRETRKMVLLSAKGAR